MPGRNPGTPDDLGRAAAHLKWYADGTSRMSWAEVAAELGLPRSRVRSAARRYIAKEGEGFQEAPPILDNQQFENEGNYARASATGKRVKSLEDLIEACHIDLNVWSIRKWGVKTWEGYAANVHKDLTYDAGRATGIIQREGIITAPMWSVWADLLKLSPEPVHPTIRPVACEATFSAPPMPEGGVLRSLVWADPHFGFRRDMRSGALDPFHDRLALDIIVQVALAAQPDRIDCLGDFFDFASWSDKYLADPGLEYTTQPAIVEGHWWLRQFREACPNAAISIHEGNHDDRMQNAIVKHLRAAYGLRPADELDMPEALSPERLLALHKLGIEWCGDYPDDSVWLTENLRLAHGDVIRGAPGATTKAYVENDAYSSVTGHIHRAEMASHARRTRDGVESITAYCPGCVCRVDGVIPGHTQRQNWRQGFAVLDYVPETGEVSICDIPVRDGIAVWNLARFVGRDNRERLHTAAPEWAW
jgi:hypothetical protein